MSGVSGIGAWLRGAVFAAVCVGATAGSAPAWAEHVLIVDDGSGSGDYVASELVARGDTSDRSATVPGDLSAYDLIIDLRSGDGAALTGYQSYAALSGNRKLLLLGEYDNGGANPRTAALATFVSNLGGGTVTTTGGIALENRAQTVTAAFNTPNVIGTVNFAGAGIVSGVGNGAFISTLGGGTTGSAILFEPGDLTGAPNATVVVVYDGNWLDGDYYTNDPDYNNGEFFQNTLVYLLGPGQSAPAEVPTLSEWAMILFGLTLAGGATLLLQRRRLAV